MRVLNLGREAENKRLKELCRRAVEVLEEENSLLLEPRVSEVITELREGGGVIFRDKKRAKGNGK
jgi:hypothetical protein